MAAEESKLRQRTDGRLDRSRDPAILDAALEALDEHGYDATNMNDIAARAGVGKAAIYRRWSSKAALMADALVHWRPDLLEKDVPDTGTLAGDLEAVVERVRRNEDNRVSTDLVLRVAMEAMKDCELASALEDLMLLRGGQLMTTILDRAAQRGEIPADRDRSMAADVTTAMSLLRVVRGQRVDAAFLRQVIDTLMLPAVTCREPRSLSD
jgi:AcrR family transcriptional regulator